MNNKYYRFVTTDGGRYEEIEGKKVVIPGHEDKDLFLMRTPDAYYSQKGWLIAEAQTGLAVTTRHNTKPTCLDFCKQILDGVSEKRYQKSIETHISKHGISPRYAEETTNVSLETAAV